MTLRRHVDHLCYRYSESAEEHADNKEQEKELDDSDDWPLPNNGPALDSQPPAEPLPVLGQPSLPPRPASATSSRPRGRPRKTQTHIPSRIPIRHSTRTRPPMDRYSPKL